MYKPIKSKIFIEHSTHIGLYIFEKKISSYFCVFIKITLK